MIQNRVEKSGLIQLDLSDFKKQIEIAEVDLVEFLFQGMILKEKDFREKVKQHDWSQYENRHVAIFCSEDVIIPLWAYMVITSELNSLSKSVHIGNRKEVLQIAVIGLIERMDVGEYQGQRVIVKGCGEDIPAQAYIALTEKLQPVVKSLMFGEACSTVPVYKT